MKSLIYEPAENANMLSKPNSTTLAAIILIKAISNSLTKISLRFGKFLTLSVLCIHCAIGLTLGLTMFFLCFPFAALSLNDDFELNSRGLLLQLFQFSCLCSSLYAPLLLFFYTSFLFVLLMILVYVRNVCGVLSIY